MSDSENFWQFVNKHRVSQISRRPLRGAMIPASCNAPAATRRLRLEALEERRMLAAVTVSNALDVVNGNTSSLTALTNNDGGDGISLREAIVAANHSDGLDEIMFDATLSGLTITLGGTQLVIADALTIDATALLENIAIDADQQSRIFNIDSPGVAADDFDVTLAGLTLTGGKTTVDLERGGAIRSFATGTVTLVESTVRGNQTEANRSGGGGIRVAGDLVLTRSTVSGNSTLGDFSRGGGIDALGAVTLTQSTVSGNSTQGLSTDGGGIRATGVITVTQSTVTDNRAISANATGGGIWNNNDPIVVSNSIIAGNIATGGDADLRPGVGTLTVNFSLIGDTLDMSQSELESINAGTGNLLDVDPLLDVLADNGGPTATHALVEGSPAIDTGGATVLVFDQRGDPFDRVLGSAVDMGAVEGPAAAPSPFLVTTVADELDFSNEDVSLREAIVSANDNLGFDTITFSSLFDIPQSIDIDSQLPTITEELTIIGPGQDLLTIDAGDGDDDSFASGDGYRLFHIDDGDNENQIDVSLSGLTLTGGDTPNGLDGTDDTDGEDATAGGAIRSLENLTVVGTMITGNATGDGGEGEATGIGGNGGDGGGISVSGNFTLISSTIKDNRTGNGGSGDIESGVGGAGGGLVAEGQATIVDSTISGNSTGSGGNGGGASLSGGGSVTNSTISGNSIGASLVGGGGGLYATSSLSINSSTIWGNSSNLGGGGLRSPDTFTINSSIIAGNSSVDGNSDIFPFGEPELQIDYSLIGDTSDLTEKAVTELEERDGNLLDVDPQLSPLADNGGPTETHALLSASPAINAGDPSITSDSNEFDQRGATFIRVLESRIDMGAFESEAVTAAPSADFDGDNDIDGGDFLAWQRGFGKLGAVKIDGDADGDADVDADDLAVWHEQFGQPAHG